MTTWNETRLAAVGIDRAELVAQAMADSALNTDQARRLAGGVRCRRARSGQLMGVTGTHSDGVPVIAYCVRRAGGPVLAERSADESFYAASTVKLAVLVAAARALEAGTVTLETTLASADTFASEAPGAPDFRIEPDDIDEGMPPAGTPMTLADVIERMIVVSSNEATNMVVELLGRDVVNAALADAGATSSTFGRKYSDHAAARVLGGSHRCSARDLAALMSAVVAGALAGPELTLWMTEMLGRQHDRQLTAHAPDGVPFGSKSGWVDGIRHDVAFVGEPGPDALVVAVCTRWLRGRGRRGGAQVDRRPGHRPAPPSGLVAVAGDPAQVAIALASRPVPDRSRAASRAHRRCRRRAGGRTATARWHRACAPAASMSPVACRAPRRSACPRQPRRPVAGRRGGADRRRR